MSKTPKPEQPELIEDVPPVEAAPRRGVEKPKKPRAPKRADGPPVMRMVKITDYKVITSAGRLIKGDRHELPESEADQLIENKQAESVE